MRKKSVSLNKRSAEISDIAISVDSSAFYEKVEDNPRDDSSVNKLQVEYAMKVRGTRAVSYAPACYDESPSSLDLSMFPGAVSGQVLIEGIATLASAGSFGQDEMGVLMTEDGQIYPDDLLFRGFIGRRVQVIKSVEGLLVKKIYGVGSSGRTMTGGLR